MQAAEVMHGLNEGYAGAGVRAGGQLQTIVNAHAV
jgi:hypothetical protein